MKKKICTRCLMDDTVANIQFDEEGKCNYCNDMINRLSKYQPKSPVELDKNLEQFVAQIKYEGRNKRYDCIVGVSGGADSAYALYLACKMGLRPLAVHMDNGWNSELAVNNIENLVRKLEVDLYTKVVNWKEYRALQQSFFDADVIDIELLYDNAMLAVNYKLARKYGIKYILSGSNTTTEGMRVPSNYNWNKFDKKNILFFAKRNNIKIKSLPTIGVIEYVWQRLARRTKWVPFLDYIDYNKQKCIDILVSQLGYRPYPYKHYESIFTRFYQGYLLPAKFGIDKRRLHLSSLICSGQISREEAEKLLEKSPYPDEDDLNTDIEYFLKKMGWSEKDLLGYINRPQRAHDEFPSEAKLYENLLQIQKRYLPGY